MLFKMACAGVALVVMDDWVWLCGAGDCAGISPEVEG